MRRRRDPAWLLWGRAGQAGTVRRNGASDFSSHHPSGNEPSHACGETEDKRMGGELEPTSLSHSMLFHGVTTPCQTTSKTHANRQLRFSRTCRPLLLHRLPFRRACPIASVRSRASPSCREHGRPKPRGKRQQSSCRASQVQYGASALGCISAEPRQAQALGASGKPALAAPTDLQQSAARPGGWIDE